MDDVYSGAVGNTLVEVGVSPTGFPAVAFTGSVLDNDTDTDGPSALTVTGVAGVSAGAVVDMNTDGTFTYLPPAGFTGSDTFTYTLSDGAQTDTAMVTITTAGRVWYVDDSAAPGGTGRSTAPFNGLAALQGGSDPDSPGDILFVYAGTYSGGIALEANQQLIGQGVALVVGGHTLVTAGTRPSIGNAGGAGVTLASGNTLRGLDVSASSGLVGSNVGTLTVNNAAVDASAGAVVSINTGTLAVTLDHASATGGTNGILLANTGGTFAVTGSGAVAASGGTIHATSGDGVSLTNVTGVALGYMDIRDNLGSGISGDGVTTFSLVGSTITDNGDTADGTEAGLRFGNLLGTCSVTGTTISGSFEDNVRLTPTAGVLDLTISGSTIKDNAVGTGGNGITILGSGTADVTVRLQGGTQVSGNQASGLLTSFLGSSAQHVTVTGSVFQNNNVAVDLGADEASTATFDVSNNADMSGQTSNAIQVFAGSSCTTCTLNGTIAGNTIGNPAVSGSGSADGRGILVDVRGSADGVIAVTGNAISHTDKEGISAQARLGSPTLDLTVTGNTVDVPDDDEPSVSPVNPFGILVQSRNTSTLCLNLATNQSAGAGTGTGYRVRQLDTATFDLERFAGVGTSAAAVDAFVTGENTAGAATMTTVTTQFTGVADGACRTPSGG
ncbi:MAG: hypothetical protein E6J56_25100 [Deltaproteobacteria bacterium]|nr:MAG: hypothetical protein E6J56_25100 [Deltaproteobacteria bacterium]